MPPKPAQARTQSETETHLLATTTGGINPNAISGPSSSSFQLMSDSLSPSPELRDLVPNTQARVAPQPLPMPTAVDENGEVMRVPAFLQKLYSMVSNEDTGDLIYWSDNGASFYIPNSEEFSKMILPRFFKHNNFSSFVRQLNMYGFHKVPHLQSGVLKNDTNSELWEFVNPNFKKDQQHLLHLVSRKHKSTVTNAPAAASTSTRQSARQTTTALLTDGTTQGSVGAVTGPTANQLLDLTAISNGINAIRKNQQTITEDLKQLQTANAALWQEASASRERHRKHQKTINRILQFLATMFNKDPMSMDGLTKGKARARDDTDDVNGQDLKRRRLGLDRMIGDGTEHVDVEEPPSEDDLMEIFGNSFPNIQSQFTTPRLSRQTSQPSTPNSEDNWTSAPQRFTNISTPDEDGVKIELDSSSASGSGSRSATEPPRTGFERSNALALSPGIANANSNPLASLDPTTFASLLNSPTRAAAFLSNYESYLNKSGLPGSGGQTGETAMYPHASSSSQTLGGDLRQTASQLALLSPSPPPIDALQASTNALTDSYKDALQIGSAVEDMNHSVEHLARSIGLDLDATPPGGIGQGESPVISIGEGGYGDAVRGTQHESEFNVDDFMEGFSARSAEEAAAHW